jgi:hypothetical protein
VILSRESQGRAGMNSKQNSRIMQRMKDKEESKMTGACWPGKRMNEGPQR